MPIAHHADPDLYISPQSGLKIGMAKVLGLSVLVYTAVPILIFFAADRAFEGNWTGVAGFLLDAAACALFARMTKWASKNL